MVIRRLLYLTTHIVIAIMLVSICTSCSHEAGEETNKVSEELKEYHFRGMDISLPKSWKGSGNMCNFYRNTQHPGAYVMVAVLDESFDMTSDELKDRLEEDISENLELFESTEFYKHKIEFVYEYSLLDDATGDRLVSGTLKNERLGIEMLFYGYYMENPVAYVFGICKDDEQLKVVRSVIDGAIASAYIDRDATISEIV